jgi:hypothetical protein
MWGLGIEHLTVEMPYTEKTHPAVPAPLQRRGFVGRLAVKTLL